MNEPRTVTVYNFRVYESHAEQPRIETFKATPAAIADLGGELIKGTGQEVPADELDDRGCYRRAATGWGELR